MNNISHRKLWKAYASAAHEARQRGDLGSAYRMLRTALCDSEEYEELDPSLIQELHGLAFLYFTQHKDADAKDIYKHLMEVKDKLACTWLLHTSVSQHNSQHNSQHDRLAG
jgi:hypothetical protein